MRPAELNIDVNAIRHNISIAKEKAPHSKLVAMVKANAYGHGIELVCPHIDKQVSAFGVGFLDEALAVNELAITKPIVIYEGYFSKDELLECSEKQFQVCVHEPSQLAYLLEAKLPKPLTVWLKYDSGMHRLGFNDKAFVAALQRLKDCDNVSNIILMSHLACADDTEHVLTDKQVNTFTELTESFAYEKSMANSAATLTRQETHFDYIRPGIMLYGGAPIKGKSADDLTLKPSMHLSAAVMALREIDDSEFVGYGARWQAIGKRKIATLSCGYGDGYPRLIHPQAHVLLNGHQCPVVGQISMELTTVDVTHLDSVSIGDRATLWGEGLACQAVASWANTIDYELMTRACIRIKPQLMKG